MKQSSDKILQVKNDSQPILLTKSQVQFLNRQLPKGFSLQPLSRHQNNTSKYYHPSKLQSSLKTVHKSQLKQYQKSNQCFSIQKLTQSHYYCRSNDEFFQCHQMLNKIKNHQYSWVLKLKGDDSSTPIPHESLVRQRQQDLSEIEAKLKSNKYLESQQFHKDMRNLFLNSYTVNSKNTLKYNITLQLEVYYRQHLKEFKVDLHQKTTPTHSMKDIPHHKKHPEIVSPQQEIHKQLIIALKKFHQASIAIKINHDVEIHSETKILKKKRVDDQPIILSEKRAMLSKIKKLSPKQFQKVMDIIIQDQKIHSFTQIKELSQDLTQIDFEKMDQKTLKKIYKFLNGTKVPHFKLKNMQQSLTHLSNHEKVYQHRFSSQQSQKYQ